MQIDPEIKVPEVFTLSIEPCRGTSFMHGFHLGTDEKIARELAKELFQRHNQHVNGVYTVALIRDGKLFDVWDGSDWHAEMVYRMWSEELAWERMKATHDAK